MPSVQELFAWAMSGKGRLVAAALLYTAMWIVKSKLPYWEDFLAKDSGWLTSARKKFAAATLLSFAPVAALLGYTDASLGQVGLEAITILLSAMGVHSATKAVLTPGEKPAKDEAPEKDSAAEDEGDDEEDDDQDGDT